MKASQILELVDELDGHGIFDGAGLSQDYPCPMIERLTTTHRSDGTIKGSITGKNGKPAEEMQGVYGLDLLWAIADAVGANTSEARLYGGRGKVAKALQSAIHRKLTDGDQECDLK